MIIKKASTAIIYHAKIIFIGLGYFLKSELFGNTGIFLLGLWEKLLLFLEYDGTASHCHASGAN